MSSYLDKFKQDNPRVSEYYNDDQIIEFLPKYDPQTFGNLSPEQVRQVATDDRSSMRRGLSAGIDQMQAIGGGLVGIVGDAIGSDRVRDFGLSVYNRNMEEAAMSAPETNFTEIDGAGDAFNWAGYTLGNLIPSMATTLAGGGIGGILAKQGAKEATKRLTARLVANGMSKEMAAIEAGKFLGKRAALGQALGASAASIGLESGSIYGETGDAGVSAVHGAIAGGIDALPVMRIFDRFGIGREARDALETSVIREFVTQAPLEAGTEGLQTLIEQHAQYWAENEAPTLFGNQVDWNEVIEASAAGALGGGLMGGGAALANKAFGNSQPGGRDNLNQAINDADRSAETVRARGGDALDAELARASTAEAEVPNAVRTDIEAGTRTAQDLGIEFPQDQSPAEPFSQGAADQTRSSTPEYRRSAAERLMRTAERFQSEGNTQRADVARRRAEAILRTLEAEPVRNTNQRQRMVAATWTGRRGDGYATLDAAQAGLQTRQKVRPDLDWEVELVPATGRYQIVGYGDSGAVPVQPADYRPPQTDFVDAADYRPLRSLLNPEESQAFDALETEQQQQLEKDYEAAILQRSDQQVTQAAEETAKNEVMAQYRNDAAPINQAMANALLKAYSQGAGSQESTPSVDLDSDPQQVVPDSIPETTVETALPEAVEAKRPDPTPVRTTLSDAEIEQARIQREKFNRQLERRRVNAEEDSLIQAVIKMGGINPEWKQDIIGDTKGNKSIPGIGWLFSPKGTSPDDIATRLVDEGFMPYQEYQNLGGVPWLMEKLGDEYAGLGKTYSLTSSKRIREELAALDEQYDREMEELENQREEEYAAIEREYGQEASDLAREHDQAIDEFLSELDSEAEQNAEQIEQREADLQTGFADGLTATQAAASYDQLRQTSQREGAAEGGNRSPATRNSESARPELTLESQTEQSAREAERQTADREKSQQKAKQRDQERAQADAERDDFRLTGSAAPADKAASYGQNDLLTTTRGSTQQAQSQSDGDDNARIMLERGGAQEKVGSAYFRAVGRGPVTTEQTNDIREYYSGDKGLKRLQAIAIKHGDESISDLMDRVITGAGISTQPEAIDSQQQGRLPDGYKIVKQEKGPFAGQWRVVGPNGFMGAIRKTQSEAVDFAVNEIEQREKHEKEAQTEKKYRQLVANKIRSGQQPSNTEWEKSGLADNYQINRGYVYQSDISEFLVEHFGLPKNNIRNNIGDAAGYLVSDMGNKTPIVYLNKLHKSLASTPSDLVDAAAAEVDTNPTDAQKEAGNYQKGHVRVQGLDITIENPKGSERSGRDQKGNEWSVTMQSHYGYIKRTEGADGEHVDVFIGPNPDSNKVFVIDQVNTDGSFDEHKVMIGFDSQKAAVDGYKSNYTKGWKVGPVTSMDIDQFKHWVSNGDITQPLNKTASSEAVSDSGVNKKSIADVVATRIAEAESRGIELSESDKSKIKNIFDEKSKLERELGASDTESHLDGVAKYFHLGTVGGSGRNVEKLNRRREKSMERSITQAGERVKKWNKLEFLDKQVNNLLNGVGTDADKTSRLAKEVERKRQLAQKAITYKKGGKFGDYIIEKVTNTRDGYPSKVRVKDESKSLIDADFELWRIGFDSKQEFHEYVDEARKNEQSSESEAITQEPKSVIEKHSDFVDELKAGNVTVDQYMNAFNELAAARETVIADLESETKKTLLERLPQMRAYRYKSEKKDRVVTAAYLDMIDDFMPPTSSNGMYSFSPALTGDYIQNHIDAVRKKIETVSQEQLDSYAERIATAKAERKKAKSKALAGMENPETLDDYMNIMRHKVNEQGMTVKEARLSLSLEQRIAFDDLYAQHNRDQRNYRKDQARTSVTDNTTTTGAEIIATKHTRDGYDLFVVKAADRVEREVYKQWLAAAKKMGGWYSKFRGNGAVPGFQFKTREAAEAFQEYISEGDASAVREQAKTRRDEFKDDRSQSAAQRLREMADSLETRADAELSKERKTNTSRRAGMAARAEQAAESDKATAITMRRIADAIENGDANFLDSLRTKTQIDMLQTMVYLAKGEQLREKYPDWSEREKHSGEKATPETADYADYPSFTLYRSDWAKLGRQLQETEGGKQIGKRILSVADDVTDSYLKFAKDNLNDVATFQRSDGGMAAFKSKKDAEQSIARSGFRGQAIVLPVKRGENLIILSPAEAQKRGVWKGDGDKRITLRRSLVEEVLGKMRQKDLDIPWQLETANEKLKRLSSMGIESAPELRAALREFISLQETAKEPDKIKQMERAMIGRANDGLDFFPTPESIADEMVETADIQEGMSVLEPSAGMGHIAERIRAAGVEPDVVEYSSSRRELLEAKGFNVVANDFLEVDEQYDRIIMNPPFSDRRDAEHVKHAYDLLKPGGKMVAIMGEGVFFGRDKKAQGFREWLESVGGSDEKLAEGTFNDPSLPVNTGVNARMVVIEKGESDSSARFSRGVPINPIKLSQNDAELIAASFAKAFPGTGEITIVDSMEDPKVPSFIKRKNAQFLLGGAKGQPAGFYFNGQSYVVLDGVEVLQGETDAQAILRVMAHEALGHNGLHAVFGDDIIEVLDEVADKRKADVQRKAKQYGLDMDITEQRREAAEEVLAELAQTHPENSLVVKAIEVIRKALKHMYAALPNSVQLMLDKTKFVQWVSALSDAEMIERFIVPARQYMRDPDRESGFSSAAAFSRAGRSGSDRSVWGDDFPKVPFAAKLGAASAMPEYAAAKSGDLKAAKAIVDNLVDEQTLDTIREMIGDSSPIVVPVFAMEATGNNALPLAYAAKIAQSLDLPYTADIVQSVRAHRTNTGSDYRLANHAIFNGPVESGAEYLIVDDTMAMGGTLASLRGHIEANGGKVIGASALTGFGDNGQLALTEKMRQDLWRKHGEPLNDYLQEEFGYGIDSLTQGEAGHFRKAASLESIRDRITAARSEAVDGSTDADVTLPQTETPQFKKWFGNSKVVDQNGEPLVVYHGSPDARFVHDDGIFKGSNERWGMESDGRDRAFWFAKDRSVAATYADDRRAFDYQNADPEVIPAYLSLKDPLIIDGEGKTWREAQQRGKTSDVINQARAEGHDGVIIQNVIDDYNRYEGNRTGRATDTYVVFDSAQIKSATDNAGTFDPGNPDIRFSRSGPSGKDIYDRGFKSLGNKDKTIFERAKKALKREFLPGGLLPNSVFNAKLERDFQLNGMEFDIANRVGHLDQAVQAGYGKKYSELSDSELKTINEALGGSEPDTSIPEQVREEIVKMRLQIRGLSEQYANHLKDEIEILQAQGSDADAIQKAALLQTILSNLDTYVHRSYRAFDDPNWPRKVSRETYDAAATYLEGQYQEQGLDDAEVADKVSKTIELILEEGTAFDSMEAFIKESKLGAKDLSVLQRRKQIAPEIRALLGEYTDPKLNFTKTVTKMSRLVMNQSFLDQVREIGLQEGFLFEKENRPLDATARIAADSSEVYAPLNGLYTYPEVEQAFRDALGKEQMADWYRAIVRMNGIVKYGKTVLSPTTAMRNWMSAAFFAMANGHFNFTQMSKSLGSVREYFTHGEGKDGYLRKLKELGVIYDTPYAGEMMDLLADSQLEHSLFDKGPLSNLRRMNEIAQKFYQYGDDFWKILGFENEKAMLMKHRKMTEAQAEREAAERIRNTYPTYSMTGRFVQRLRRFPLAGTFVSFPAEIIRTSYHILRYLKKDMKESPGMGRRKIAGLAIASGMIHALQSLSMAMLGMDDDEEEAFRDLAAPWQRNSNLLVLGRNEKGQLRLMDMSFLDPYNYWKRPINAIMRDQPIGDAITDSARELFSPFFGQDIAFGAIMEAVNNKKQSGGRVFNPHAPVADQVVDIVDHIRKSVQPGIAANAERLYRASTGQVSSSGRPYKLDEEMAALMGFRGTTFDPKGSIYFRAFEFQDRKADATQILTSVARNPNSVSERAISRAFELAKETREEAYQDMIQLVNAAKSSGLSNSDIVSALRDSGVSRQDSGYLIRGRVPPWQPGDSLMRGAVKKANVLFDSDTAEEFKRRQRLIMDLATEAP